MSADDRLHVAAWIVAERSGHADTKWTHSANRSVAMTHMREDPGGHWWVDYVSQYMKRASLIGLNTPQGRQLLGKAVVTALHALETAVEVYGPLPEPGHPSGDVQPWIRPEPPAPTPTPVTYDKDEPEPWWNR